MKTSKILFLENINKSILVLQKIKTNRLLFLIDSGAYRYHKKNIDKIVNACGDRKDVIFVKGGESVKKLLVYSKIVEEFLAKKITRKDHLVVIGGGATSDLGGLVAATLLRGISWSVLPTTLLSMIDASIGGKVGVNSRYGKNLIGSFWMPTTIIVNPSFLKTLSKKEIDSGSGEIIKYAFLSKDVYRAIMSGKDRSIIIKKCAIYKQSIVKDDFLEKGKRKILNLGHTIGHAIEKKYHIPHGISVALGIKKKLEIFKNTQMLEAFDLLCKKQSLKLELLESKIKYFELKPFFLVDKKQIKTGILNLIVSKKIGVLGIKKITIDRFMDFLK